LKRTIYKTICVAIAVATFGRVNSHANENLSNYNSRISPVKQYFNIIRKLDSKGLNKEVKPKISPIKTVPLDYENTVNLLFQLRTGYQQHVLSKFTESVNIYNNLLSSSQLPGYMKSFIIRQKPLAEARRLPTTTKDYLTLINSTRDPYLILSYSSEGLIIDGNNFNLKDKADSAAFTVLKKSLSHHKAGRYSEASTGYDTIAANVLLDKHYANRAKELKALASNGVFKSLGGMVIVLDAGHNFGGNDGAYGNGYSERELNMQVVLKLKEILEAQGAGIVLTRSPGEIRYESSGADLSRRTTIAASSQADLFISIHHDSSTNKSAGGSTVFYSSYKNGVNTSAAYVLVESGSYLYTSNTSSTRAGYVQGGQELKLVGEVSKGFTVNYNGKNLFISNSTSKAINPSPSHQSIISRDLAGRVVSNLSSGLVTRDRGIGDRNLYVTRNTKMASILVEVGFISNYNEITKISKPEYQIKASNEIMKAVISIYGAQ
jgi:N-acetylmuramoyl-L-alanine amidase